MEQRAKSYHSQGLNRALGILRLLGKSNTPLTLASIAAELDLPKSTAVRLLLVMEEEGFVRRSGEHPAYSIGYAIHEIAEGYRPVSMAEITAPVLSELADEVGFTANLGLLEGPSVLHLHVAEPQRALRFATGGMLDFAYCTGLGKLLMSVLPEDEIDAHLPESEPYATWTPRTISTRAGIVAELAQIREAGYSVDDEERNRGVTCMAVLLPTNDAPMLALSISAPSAELDAAARKQYLPILNAAAAALVALPEFDAALAPLRTRMALA
ncbi:transcriptional regulator, IclR family [Agrococcus baldri]|jgi:IclR family acetate operon transcriptional repressor|uniref:Transcriptional regulator, IclR family n=1 Tax=Agrococcus baldri TaxID=153730 RepID=A0AA94KZ41_9MICO|nr:IclR family transcriptional regulator [Agrococcus baldri]SFS06805.1 transcriptional regulator, IclR family [Agrococcus baldri]